MKRVGIKDVARQAGVSAATVSLVLNGRHDGRISDLTQERVRRVAEEMGYQPNSLARGLAMQQTQTIGIISDEIATTPFAVRMVEAAQEAARARGYLLFLLNTGADPQVEREAIDILLRQQVAGLIYACMYHRVVGAPPGLPPGTVFLDGRPKDGGYPAVIPDDRGGARAATDALIEHGHRRIAFIDVDEEAGLVASGLRLEGYRDALRGAGLPFDPSLHVRGAVSAAGGRTATGVLLDLPAGLRPTALFCFNDRMAMGAYHAAADRDMQIPDDVSIVGYDDQQYIAAELDPPLTTVALPHYEMGRWAVEALFRHLEGTPDGHAEVLHMPCPLIRRDSVGPPPG